MAPSLGVFRPPTRASPLKAGRRSHSMTRFKEKARIDHALDSGDPSELRWAVWYCRSRLSIPCPPRAQKHWRDLLAKVEAKLNVASSGAQAGGKPT